MARIGSTPVAMRYDGIPVGPRFAYLFELQAGVPVDGTNEALRNYSPFTLRFVLPEELSASAPAPSTDTVADQARNVTLVGSAAAGSNVAGSANQSAAALALPSSTGTEARVAMLESFVAGGEFFSAQQSGFATTIVNALTAADVALQVERLRAAEPLVLLVNPAEFSIDYTKVQSYQSRTRKGYVFEAWGEEQPTISVSGSTGGFVAGAVDTASPFGGQASGNTTTPSGYQWASRRDSAAWQNFASLYHFYRNNGYVYDTVGKTDAHLFAGSVSIEYDQVTYTGNIDSFSFTFDEGTPLRVTFDMEFKVCSIVDGAKSGSTVVPLNAGGAVATPQTTFASSLGVLGDSVTGTQSQAVMPFDLLPG